MIAPAIRLREVGMAYSTPAGVVRALDGISLAIAAGESLAIVGPSGCGKSTLLGLMGGLDSPTGGEIWIGEQEISTMAEPQRAQLRRRAIGFVFQSDNLHPFLTVVENVGLQLALHGAGDHHDRCVELLEGLGLGRELDKLPDQLSGGQRQRVAVARALVGRPEVILADEPTGALDPGSSASVIDLLLTSCAESGTTLVIVTHDPAAAARCDANATLRDGRLAERGIPVGAR